MSADDQKWALPPQHSLPQLVEARLVSAIRSGDLKAGERIVETQLARQLNVSRGPLREALKSLEANGLVFTVRGKGTYVAEVSHDDFVRMTGIRAVLEGFAARLVAARCRHEPDVVVQLEQSLAELERAEAGHDAAVLRAVDWEFHELVCTLADNDLLQTTWHSISSLVRLYQQGNTSYEVRSESVVHHHHEFVEALKSGDPDFAEQTFRSIITDTTFRSLGLPVPEAMTSMTEPPRAPKKSKAGAR
ncbi:MULTISPECIES: GntR family transcriptional regulator [unclassified Caballeronia]|uniref:GntR family transcriptional regulator n=1 Tax=unclassified Caballeronia TaxID=2646786 RepID=UPI00285B2A26|nr:MULTISPECIES: GntR family transcriptional regulator [unclassified Caballeronia]MDR5815106.1 GntR family transcriptional regulator [Caballeronia sp. LZ033]MDR5821575.1 GntR family transcriptional regulator [Caballeronia sp. LZ043]MDR5879798.1 GntR family transcriptional regulator [Caballeronia sp. LZ032]